MSPVLSQTFSLSLLERAKEEIRGIGNAGDLKEAMEDKPIMREMSQEREGSERVKGKISLERDVQLKAETFTTKVNLILNCCYFLRGVPCSNRNMF